MTTLLPSASWYEIALSAARDRDSTSAALTTVNDFNLGFA